MAVAPQLEQYRLSNGEEAEPLEEVRMSFGEHLEELRTRLIRALIGVALATVLAFVYGQELMQVVLRPLLVVQAAHGLQPHLQSISPASAFMVYMKLAFLAGLLVGMPWVLHNAWQFVSAGMYPRERRFVKGLTLPSLILFALGVLFLYFIVLPLMLQFFITFNRAFPIPDLTPASVQRWLLPGKQAVTSDVAAPTRVQVPVLTQDPPDAAVGDLWVNSTTGRLVLKSADGYRSIGTEPGVHGTVIESQFALDHYVSFVLTLALAFGVAFETPVVVFFLAWTGLVTLEAMRRGRRFVIVGVVAAAAILTPTPDLIGQLLLAGPIYLLFELGLLVARCRVPSA